MRSHVSTLQTVLALLVAGLVAAGIWFYRVQERQLDTQVRAQLESIARLKCDQIAAWRATRLAEAAVIAEGPFLSGGVLRLLETNDPDTAQAMMERLLSIRRHYGCRNVMLVDATGGVRVALDQADRILHPEVRSALEDAFRNRRAALANLHVEPGLREPHISAVAPFFDRNAATNTPAGALILVTEARHFLFPLVSSWPVPSKSAETLLVQRDGDSVLYLNDLRHQSNTALQLRIPLSRTNLPAVQVVQGRSGEFAGRDYRDVEVIASLQPVPDSPWFMVAKMDAAEAFQAWRSRSIGIVAFILLLILLAAGGVALLWLGNDKDHYRRLYEAESARRASEARYRTTLMSVGDGVIATDAEGRVRLMNPVAESLAGWAQKEAEGRPLEDVFRIVNEDTRQTVENPVRRVVREGVVVGLANHTVLIARDGREAPIADSGAPIRDDAGAISGVVLVFRDQTHERNTMRAMADSEARFHSLFDNMAEGVALHELVRDADGRPVNYTIVGINAQYGRILGLQDAAVVGRLGTEVYGTPEAPYLTEFTAAAAGRPARFEVHFEPMGRHFEISAVPWGKDGFASIFSDITARKKAELRLQESEQRFRTTLDSMMEGCQIVGPDWRYLYINEVAAGHAHRKPADLVGRTMMECFPGIETTPLFAALERCMAERRAEQLENEFVYGDGGRGWFQLGIQPVPEGLFILSIDITDRRKAEAEHARLQDQLLQAKKMESIGRLAGGVAHDFNNMLQTMLGNVELALETPGASEPLIECLREIQQAGRHSVELTRQLLGFARKQTINPRVLALNDTIAGMMGMLRRLIGEDIELSWSPAEGLWNVTMDPFQVQQILANLAANARDAIGGVGRITIETGNVTLDESYVKTHPEATAGDYVLLAVSDTGPGISREVRDHLFEPFFTTKETGRGTGLGLATIYGIVKQNRGTIGVYSEPGEGAVFKVYLPRSTGPAETVAAPGASDTACIAAAPGGTETILLVEDELAILRLGTRVLKKLGYTVLAADTPARALQIAAEHPGPIELLITDVVMPEMTGRELERRLHALKPDVKCLYMSGYTANVIAHRGILDKGVNFIQKPFSMEALAEQARRALAS